MVIGKLDIDKAVACHIYQIVTAKTVPEHHSMLMAYTRQIKHASEVPLIFDVVLGLSHVKSNTRRKSL